MLYFRAFLCVLIVLVFGASYFIRKYKQTKLVTYRLVCWWGRIASGLLMVAGGMFMVIMLGMFIDTLIKAVIYSGRSGMNLKEFFSELSEDNGLVKLLLVVVIDVVACNFGHKSLVNYNEMFLSESNEANNRS